MYVVFQIIDPRATIRKHEIWNGGAKEKKIVGVGVGKYRIC